MIIDINAQPNHPPSFHTQEKSDDESNQLFVFFPEDDKVGVKPIKVYTDRMKEEGVSNAILVLRVDITPFAKQAVQEVNKAATKAASDDIKLCTALSTEYDDGANRLLSLIL